MSALRLRSAGDVRLFESLTQHRLVQKVIERIAREEEKGIWGTRRRLLATSLRLTPSMAPELTDMVAECKDALGVETPAETYVYPSAAFNAAAVKPEGGRLFLMFSSSLLESFQGAALRFVVGHELGHHLYDHHAIPIGMVLKSKEPVPKDLLLQLFAWSRYAEISADRAGALCANDANGVAQSLFRLASGFRTEELRMDIDEFASQVDAMKESQIGLRKGVLEDDWFSTHPFSPLRLKAVRAFFRSELYKNALDSDPRLEAEVQSLMALMEPSYLEGKTPEAEAMRRLLFAAGLKVARAKDGVSEQEAEVFENLLGDGVLPSELDEQALESLVEKRIARVREVTGPGQPLQLVRDLGLIANADGRICAVERRVICGVAKALGLDDMCVERTLTIVHELD